MHAVAHQRAGVPPNRDDSATPRESSSPPCDEAAADLPADARTTIAGRYAVDLQTAPEAGGIAVAYRGRDLRTRDPVVVKTLRLEYRNDPDLRARFRREARLLQFLSHPNVIRALAFVEERGAPWLVLESVHGQTLREVIARDAPMPPEAVVPILRGLAAGLDHLHARGLVHLDVRPDNAVVAPDDDVKLVDFGLAQTSGTTQDPADLLAPETVAYFAPEQACGDPVTPATDVYALGCIIYEMLTGQPPFAPDNRPAMQNAAIRARLEQPPLPPSRAPEGHALPVWVDDVVLGALERDPRKRYGTAGSFAVVFHSGVEGDVDVETGRPRQRGAATPRPQIPINEPGIAMRGSPRLASRRAESEPAPPSEPGVVDASFTPLAENHAPPAPSRLRPGAGGIGVDALSRRLWQAVILAAILNVALIAALFFTQGEIPGIWTRSAPIGPGASVQVAGAGLVARQGPNNAAAIVADLPSGGSVRITAPAVPGEGGLWWPIEVQTPTGPVSGYVPESWVRAP